LCVQVALDSRDWRTSRVLTDSQKPIHKRIAAEGDVAGEVVFKKSISSPFAVRFALHRVECIAKTVPVLNNSEADR
jgi:hypothetical protein